ncbi:Ferric/cupric reductase transmembrane component 7 [Daldinia childiae]|uniref:Ferric/cupric reductase transmembrane component 7 n=1 Tax=Daldinia childiae TaxID=326645 RepID=UPI0014458579|nr:Ferric/cupric reductase transmembrane component 7 [Daldinia childiae]KAF3054798.1 Ferric/cupric reductase transmembrane component 7 [Daldinia childiae]
MAENAASAMAGATRTLSELAKRIYIPLTATSPPGLVEANTVDPWSQSGKYGLGWTYFSLALMALVVLVRIWHWWQDKIRQAIYKQEVEQHYRDIYSLDPEYALPTTMYTGQTGRQFFPEEAGVGEKKDFKPKSDFSAVGPVLDTLALFRWVFYRPIPDIVWKKHRFTFSSLAVLFVGFVALAFVSLYVFLKQPLYWDSIQYGSPPVAIRAGMIAIAMTPWIVATSMKANLLTLITGIGPERLNVFHRWAGYLCLFLVLVHTIPFYIQPVWDDGGMMVFSKLFPEGSGVIYGTGIACLVPLLWLCVASLPFIRRMAYEVFVTLHVPVGFVYLGCLFWHTKNYLASWDYLYATIAIWVLCYFIRVFKLNWVKPWRMSFLVGDEAAITLMTENAIKITIPTQMKWKPGQYVYLRMPGISFLDNHPFTISSLCSEDFPSEYGEQYRDCTLVFKPYGGFTRRVLETAIDKGPFHTYRAYLDGPYGGMRRELAAFDTCILIAGGSGVTALMSQLLNLIKRMRDGKAITKKVVVVWALKRLEAMDWFREELRICRDSAPPESVTCKFFVTAAKRQSRAPPPRERGPRPLSNMFHDRLDGFVAGIASKRNSQLIRDEAQGNPDYERELRAEDEDRITALPQPKYLQPHHIPPQGPPPSNRLSAQEESLRRLEGRDLSDTEIQEQPAPAPTDEYPEDKPKREFHFPPLQTHPDKQPHFNYAPPSPRRFPPTPSPENVSGEPSEPVLRPPEFAHLRTTNLPPAPPPQARPTSTFGPPSGFDFGFPETPTEFQKSLMRFAFPVPHQIDGGWSVEYGRPDLGYMLREWTTGGSDGRGILGRRTAVFVCGPPSMREGVATTVARLQAEIWGDPMLEEIFLHTENYAL